MEEMQSIHLSLMADHRGTTAAKVVKRLNVTSPLMTEWPAPGFSCPALRSTTSLNTVLLHYSWWASEASATCWGEVQQFRRISSATWPATGLLAVQDGIRPCAQRERPCLCALQGKGKRWLFFALFSTVQGEPQFVGMQLLSFCFLFLSFSLCSAKIVSVTHLYPAGKVTCGQCCKTPGGSCGCRTEMTYVKVTKYTQKLWRRKVWFRRKLSHASWDKWETRLLAPHGSFHGTGLLTVSPESPYVR